MSATPRNAPCPCGSGRKFKHCHGGNTPLPDPERISRIYLDDRMKKMVVISKDMLLNQITRDGPKIAASFDNLAMPHLKEISALFSESVSILFPHYSGTDFKDESFRTTCARLLGTAGSSYIASIELARHGYRRQYGAMVRSSVETLCTVLHILQHKDGLRKFYKNELQSTKTIASAKNALPPFGYLYGFLSKYFVHINADHALIDPISPYKEDDEAISFIIPSMRAIVWLLYVVTELAFFDDVERPRYWKSLGAGAFSYDPSDEEKRWMQEFLEAPILPNK